MCNLQFLIYKLMQYRNYVDLFVYNSPIVFDLFKSSLPNFTRTKMPIFDSQPFMGDQKLVVQSILRALYLVRTGYFVLKVFCGYCE
jgi:hypothetical protein